MKTSKSYISFKTYRIGVISRLLFTIIIAIITTLSCSAQIKGYTEPEKKYYATIKSLTEHFKNKAYDTTQRDSVFKKFIYFDNILADTNKSTVSERIRFFDFLFPKMLHFIDSVGLENLDIAPTRQFENNKTFFKPFSSDGELNELLPLTLTYYDKRRPNDPLGVLLFHPDNNKLMAWIILNQGGYHYFLTFNIV